MTVASVQQAVNEMVTAFKAGWDTITPSVPPVAYPDAASDAFPPQLQVPWGRVTIVHATGGQATLAGAIGSRRFRHSGIFTVQVFTPVGNGSATGYSIAQTVKNALEGTATPGGVWFRNVRVNEIGPENGWHQINILADFEYDEVK